MEKWEIFQDKWVQHVASQQQWPSFLTIIMTAVNSTLNTRLKCYAQCSMTAKRLAACLQENAKKARWSSLTNHRPLRVYRKSAFSETVVRDLAMWVSLRPWPLTSKSHQFIFALDCTEVVHKEKLPQSVCKMLYEQTQYMITHKRIHCQPREYLQHRSNGGKRLKHAKITSSAVPHHW